MAITNNSTTERVAHTPGPWQLEQIPLAAMDDSEGWARDARFWIVGGPLGEVLGVVHVRPRLAAEADANANLIAAAPELLAALKAAESALAVKASLRDSEQLYVANVLADVRRAIASAEGMEER